MKILVFRLKKCQGQLVNVRVTMIFFQRKINSKKKDFIFVTKETDIFCSLFLSRLLNPLIRILKSVRRNVQMVEEEVEIFHLVEKIKYEKIEFHKNKRNRVMSHINDVMQIKTIFKPHPHYRVD